MTDLLLDWTDYVTVLVDGSGSMAGIARETVQGLNALLLQQKAQPLTWLRIVEFQDDVNLRGAQVVLKTMFDSRLPVAETRGIALSGYQPGGGTPLFSAVLETIGRLEGEVRAQDHVLVIIQTDGGECTSRKEDTLELVRSRIGAKQRDGWTFAYLGAELDSWKTGETMGMGPLNAYSYAPSQTSMVPILKVTSDAIDRWRKDHAQSPGRAPKIRHFFPLQLPAPRGDDSA